MIYWGLMKWNDRSVQETQHYLLHYYLLPRASGKQSGVMSGSWTNHSFEPVLFGELDELVQISLNQNSLSDAWLSLRLEMSRNTAVYLILWWMIWFSAPVPPTVTELSKQFDSDRRQIRVWYVHTWTESLNERFYGFSLFMWWKRWANEN